MAAPVVSLGSPANNGTRNPASTILTFYGIDAESNGIAYNLQLDTANTFDSDGGNPLIDVVSSSDNGFFEVSRANFTDPLKANSLDTSKWTQSLTGNGTAGYSSSGASLNLPTSAASGDGAKITGTATIDLSAGPVSFHMTTRPSTSTTASYVFWLMIDVDNWFRFSFESGTIYCQRKYSGGAATNGITADASFTYKYFRFRAVGTTVYWEISANGESWTSIWSETSSIALTALTPVFEVAAFGSLSNPGSMVVNNFNIPRTHASGTDVSFAAPTLTEGTTYYWRVRGIDPNGGNTYGSWSSTRSFLATEDEVVDDAPFRLMRFNGSTLDEVEVNRFGAVS